MMIIQLQYPTLSKPLRNVLLTRSYGGLPDPVQIMVANAGVRWCILIIKNFITYPVSKIKNVSAIYFTYKGP